MAATATTIGYGITLSKEDTPASGTYTALDVEITSLTPPGMSRDAIDATHTTSPDTHREFIEGLIDGGEVGIEGNFTAEASDVIATELLAGKASFRITFPNTNTWTFDAFFTNFAPSAPIDDKMTFSATMKLSGKSTIA